MRRAQQHTQYYHKILIALKFTQTTVNKIKLYLETDRTLNPYLETEQGNKKADVCSCDQVTIDQSIYMNRS